MSNPRESAKSFYETGNKSEHVREQWTGVAMLIFKDHLMLNGCRLSKTEPIVKPTIITKQLATELFADETPPRLLIAENQMETHDDLRAKHPSAAERISGDIIEIEGFSLRFFSMDPVMEHSRQLATKAQLPQVTEWLISQNIMPLDAEMNIIGPQE